MENQNTITCKTCPKVHYSDCRDCWQLSPADKYELWESMLGATLLKHLLQSKEVKA